LTPANSSGFNIINSASKDESSHIEEAKDHEGNSVSSIKDSKVQSVSSTTFHKKGSKKPVTREQAFQRLNAAQAELLDTGEI